MDNPLSRWWKGQPTHKIVSIKREKTVGVIPADYVRRAMKIEPTYEEMIGRYLSESRIKCAIDELVDVSVGVGFHTTCAKGGEKALEAVDDFCEDVNLDAMNSDVVRDVYITGNAVIWRQTPAKLEDLVRVPIASVSKIQSDARGRVTALEQKFKGDFPTKLKQTEVDQLYRIVMNPIDTGLIGRGLLEPYVRQGYGYMYKKSDNTWERAHRPSLAEINEEIEDMMRVAVIRYAPKFAAELGNFSEDEAIEVSNQLKRGSWMDDLTVWYKGTPEDRKFMLHRMSTDPRSRLDPFIEHFVDKELVTTQTPSVKLISKEGFTEASSRTAEAIEMRKVSAFQRFYKRGLEREIFVPVIMTKLGWSRDKAKAAGVRLHWGPVTKPQVEIKDLIESLRVGGISPNEFRKNVSEFGIVLVEGEEKNLNPLYGNPKEVKE